MTPEEEEGLERLAVRAQDLARANKPHDAEALARSVPNSDRLEGYLHEKVVAFIEIAAALGRLGSTRANTLLGEAETMASLLRSGGIWHEAEALVRIADVWGSLSLRNEALRVWRKAAEALEHAVLRDEGFFSVLSVVAQRLREAGQTEEAERVVKKHSP